MRLGTVVLGFVVGAVMVITPARARAEAPAAEECVERAERAQRDRLDGKLVDARAELFACVQPGCPAVVRKDCARWLGEVEASLPSIVLAARDGAGTDVTDVTVTIDGNPVADRLDGRAIFVDPGSHGLALARRGHPTIERRIIVREGEKLRRFELAFAGTREDGAPAGASHGTGIGTIVGWSLVGLGGAGLAVGVVGGAVSFSSPCSGGSACTSDERDSASRAGAISNVGFVTGALALAAGIIVLLVK